MKELDIKLIAKTIYEFKNYTLFNSENFLNTIEQQDFENFIKEVADLKPLQLCLINDIIEDLCKAALAIQTNIPVPTTKNAIKYFNYKFIILYLIYLNGGRYMNSNNILDTSKNNDHWQSKMSIIDILDSMKETFILMFTEEEKSKYEDKSL